MATSKRPDQFAVATCFAGSTSPPSYVGYDVGFDAFTVTFVNDGPDQIYVNLATTSSACSTGTGFAVKSGESQAWSGQAMPILGLTTTSSGGTVYRVGAWRW